MNKGMSWHGCLLQSSVISFNPKAFNKPINFLFLSTEIIIVFAKEPIDNRINTKHKNAANAMIIVPIILDIFKSSNA